MAKLVVALRLLALLFFFSHVSALQAQPSLGGQQIEGETLYFGGSFSPPTLEHMGLITNLMVRFGFKQGVMIPTTPYKQGAAPAEVSLRLTRMATDHVDEVLEINGVYYKQFKSSGEGSATWVDDTGKTYNLAVDDYEIRNNIKTDSLGTLTYLAKTKGDARQIFWVSGGDSFGSIRSWTPRWNELLEQANWLVISRPGTEGSPNFIDFRRENPLQDVLSPEVLDNYTYYFDRTNQTHVYRNKDARKPNIFVVVQPVLNDSSSENRASLAEKGDHGHAQAGLQPSVFKESVERGYYTKEKGEGYTTLTRENLVYYVNWFLSRIERKHAAELDPRTIEYFERFTRDLSDVVDLTVNELKRDPSVVLRLKYILDQIRVQLDSAQNIRRMAEGMRHLAAKYGAAEFAATFVSLEIAEATIFQPLIYYWGGLEGLAQTVVSHPNELMAVPAFVAWNVHRRLSEQRRLGGDVQAYRLINDYRHRLLLGNPESIMARAEIGEALGIAGTNLTINITKSSFPKWVPRSIRNWRDQKVKWYDLNLSTNELRAILQDDAMAKELYNLSRNNLGLYAHLLLATIVGRAEPLTRLELFVTQRYFRRIAFGDVPEELLSGYSSQEINFMDEARASNRLLATNLSADDRQYLLGVLSYVYSVNRLTNLNPSLKDDPSFWKTVIDMMVTGYPDERADLNSLPPQTVAKLHLFFTLLYETSSVLRDQTVYIEGLAALKIDRPIAFWHTGLSQAMRSYAQKKENQLKIQLMEEAALNYVDNHQAVFTWKRQNSDENSKVRIYARPLSYRGDGRLTVNLNWDIEILDKSVVRELAKLKGGFKRAGLYLQTRSEDASLVRIFNDGFEQMITSIEANRAELKTLEFRWLALKYPHRFGEKAFEESQIEGYSEMKSSFQTISHRLNENLRNMHLLISMMNGTTALDLEDLPGLKKKVAQMTGVNPPCRRFLF